MNQYDTLLSAFSSYPHVQQRIKLLWGSQEARDYIASLGVSDRIDREGFPPRIFSVINSLEDLHDELFPKFKPNINKWNDLYH